MGSNAGRTKNFRSGFRLPFSTTGMFLIILLLTCTLVCLINFKTYSHPTRHSRESFNSQTVASRYGQLFTNLAVKFWEDYKTNDKDRNFRLADKVGGGVYCEPVEFLTSMDPSLGSLDPRALCEGMSGHSDVLCRVYLHQIGVRKTEIHEDACVLQGSATKVPKIVYFVTFGSYEFQMRNYVAVLAAKRHIDPQAIYVIGDQHPTGPWWELVIRDVPGIRFVYREAPLEIAGYRIKKKEHRSDVIRLQMLYLNGGIYLDTDMVVLRSLDALLDHDLTMGLIENITGLGNAFILAKRGNSFIRDWYNGYRQYKNDVWGYNSMELANSLYLR
ncbi:uncharacterized protein LOC131940002 isoform X2 [Physella acuta]|uniref:uncharacterized protein LOC131940002 isoform X2 n=1 Tax=Physella acuta TaxID=109671 RepID=UPI0027DCF701|nr:uncharacterized protein LOC131940002 isoform X2 [Physella acuta]